MARGTAATRRPYLISWRARAAPSACNTSGADSLLPLRAGRWGTVPVRRGRVHRLRSNVKGGRHRYVLIREDRMDAYWEA